MAKYILKRLLLLFVTLFIVVSICFILVRFLPQEIPQDAILKEIIEERWESLGYNKPIIVQYFIYLRNIFTKFDVGTSWYISRLTPATEVLSSRLLPTILVNFYSLIFAIPIGIGLGIVAAIKKNKLPDHIISILVILFISIPNYIIAFIIQYLLCYSLGIFPLTIYSLSDANGWFTFSMFYSMIPAILALSFGEIAFLTRFTRAELTETLTSDYMQLARTKGLSRQDATRKHALKNAMVPILPLIIGSFVSILAGSLIIEKIFSIPGVGQLYINSIMQFDYDVFMVCTIFYTTISLLGSILVDISYGFIDPRIRMGEK